MKAHKIIGGTALKAWLAKQKIGLNDFARTSNVAPSTLSNLVTHNRAPVKNASSLQMCEKINKTLQQYQTSFEYSVKKSNNFTNQPNQLFKKGDDMLLQFSPLYPLTLKHFELSKSPFINDLQSAKDVFISRDIRDVRTSMWSTVIDGGFLSVVSESGGGKTTLMRELKDRIIRENQRVTLIEPYVLAMEGNDIKGKSLKASSIAEAIIRAVAPNSKPKRTMEARSAQLHKILQEQNRAGQKHCLVIEEAHCLPKTTLKHLKRFYELGDGFKSLLSILLIGQTELRNKLDDGDSEVREVVQRCMMMELPPLNNYLEDYLKFKLERVGGKVNNVFDIGAIDAIRARLHFKKDKTFGGSEINLLYPLAIANLVSAAMNLCTNISATKITAEIIREI